MIARNTRRKRRRGFTLMEIMLVLAILVVLASASGIAYQSIRKRAWVRAATTQVASLKGYVELYNDAYNSYPPNLECLYDATQDNDNPKRLADDKFMKDALGEDPWGNPYQYSLAGDTFEVWCWGPDGQDSTEDDIR